MTKKAILLANLGSPDNCSVPALRSYLNQFLMDPMVIQLPWIVRRLIVSLFILPFRPKASAEAYKKIWSKDGSPLVAISHQLREALQAETDNSVFIAMRYGNPSIENQILEISKDASVEKILFIPLYPHYAESTVSTSLREVHRVIAKHKLDLAIDTKSAFYNDPDYIRALVETSIPLLTEMSIAPTGEQQKDDSPKPHLLFSYHGLPEIHLTKIDPTGKHCLQKDDCCTIFSSAHKTCYRHQVFETTRLFVEKLQLDEDQYSIGFQSRLGRAKWLGPSTDKLLVALAEKGIKDLVVICPAFVTDCLETLEEIGMRGEQIFTDAGGNSLTLVPCLNDHPEWVNTLAKWCRN